MRTLLPALLLATSALLGCAQQHPPTTPEGPVLLRIVGRNETIIVRSSPAGPVYTVITPTGQILARQQTLAQLQVSNPALHRQINSALADNRIGAE